MTATLVFEPWITEKSLLRAFHEVRFNMLAKQKRQIGERQVWLFDFVETHVACLATLGLVRLSEIPCNRAMPALMRPAASYSVCVLAPPERIVWIWRPRAS